MSREISLYIEDILGAIDKIEAYVSGKTFQNFQSDPLLIDAVTFNLLVVGKASGKVPLELRSAHPEVPWSQVVGLRNTAVCRFMRHSNSSEQTSCANA